LIGTSSELVARERELVKRHNRLVDLRKEEEAKQRKLQRRAGAPPEADLPPRPSFGKESIQDDSFDNLKSAASQQKSQKRFERREKQKVEGEIKETKAEASKKRKRPVFEDEEPEISSPSVEPPKKVQKIHKDSVDSESSTAPTEVPKEIEKHGEEAQPKKAGKPASSFAEARARFEQKQKEKQEKREAFEKRQQELLKKQEEQKKTSRKLMKRTPKGQPIMRNMLSHMLGKIEKN
jgi:hypothetical protein